MVGLGRIELPTSPLSGVRSSQLSYRPILPNWVHWWSWSGSNRRPPECKSGALPAELQPLLAVALSRTGVLPERRPLKAFLNRGQLDAGTTGPAHGYFGKTVDLQVEIQSGLAALAEARTTVVEWNGYLLLARVVHSDAPCFRRLHPRSLLERR
jgi:hypothetical protein